MGLIADKAPLLLAVKSRYESHWQGRTVYRRYSIIAAEQAQQQPAARFTG
jgi:hypothetical protein